MAKDVKINFGANLRNFEIGVRGVKAHARGLNRVLKTAMKPVTLTLGALNAVSGAAVVGGLKNLAAYGAKLNHLSQSTGATVKELSVLEQTFDDVGAGAAKVPLAIQTMQRAISEAAKPNGANSYKELFSELRIDPKALIDQTTLNQFKIVSKALGRVEKDADRARLAQELFSRSGPALSPIFLNPHTLEDAEKSMGGLVDIIGDIHAPLEYIDTIIGRAPAKIRAIFAGIAVENIRELSKWATDFNNTDFTKLGREIGKFLNDTIVLVRSGKIFDFVSHKSHALVYSLGDTFVRAIKNGLRNLKIHLPGGAEYKPFIPPSKKEQALNAATFASPVLVGGARLQNHIWKNTLGKMLPIPGLSARKHEGAKTLSELAEAESKAAQKILQKARQTASAPALPIFKPLKQLPFKDPEISSAALLNQSAVPIVDSLQQMGLGGRIAGNYQSHFQQIAHSTRDTASGITRLENLIQQGLNYLMQSGGGRPAVPVNPPPVPNVP